MSMPAGRAGHFEGLSALIKQEKTAAKGLSDLARSARQAADAAAAAFQPAAPSPAPAAAAAGAAAAGGEAGGPELDAGLLASRIGEAMRAVEAPLATFGKHIDVMFDRVGGTVIESLRRIDANTKFPTIDGALTKVGTSFTDAFRAIVGLPRKAREDVEGTVKSLERSIRTLALGIRSLGSSDTVAPLEAAMKSVSSAFDSIDASLKTTADSLRALAPAAEPAAEVVRQIAEAAGKAAAAAPLLAKDFANVSVPRAGKRPGVGRAVPLDRDSPAGALGDAARESAREAGRLARALQGVRSTGTAAFDALGGKARALAGFILAVETSGRRVKLKTVLGVAGVASLAARAVGTLAQSAGGVGTTFAAVGSAAAHALSATATGARVAAGAANALSTATGLNVVEMAALGVGGLGAAGVAVRLGQAFFRTNFFVSSLGDVASHTFSQMYGGAVSATGGLSGLTRSLARLPLSMAKLPFRTVATAAGMARTEVVNFTGALRRVGVEAAAAFGVYSLATKVVNFFKDGVKGASDLAEATSAAGVTFGKFAGEVTGQADRMARSHQASRKAQIDLASGFGEIALGAGKSQKEAAAFANTFTQLAIDFNSRQNFDGGIEEAGEKLISALSGQGEVLRRFGANLDEDAVKAYAYAHGLAKAGSELSTHAKIAARAALIQNGLASATGDLARTSDSAANQFRKAGGGVTNFGIQIGEVLLPAVLAGTTAFNELLATLIEVFEASRPTIESWAGEAKAAMDTVGIGVRNMGSMFTIAKLQVTEWASNLLNWVETIPANFSILTGYLGKNWRSLLTDMYNATRAMSDNIDKNLIGLFHSVTDFFKDPTQGFKFQWTPLLDGFKSTVDKLPDFIKSPLVSVQDEINDEMAKIADREQKRADGMKKAAAPPGQRKPLDDLEGKDKKKKKEDPFAELAEAGSKEAYSAIVRHQFGGKDDSRMKDVAKNTGKANAWLEKIVDGIHGLSAKDRAGMLESLSL